MVEGPHTVAAIILEPVVGTNGILVPPDGYLAGVRADLRRVRHRDDRRRGDERLRPLRRVVRGRPLGRHARPDHLRQGRQLRLRPARWRDHLRRDRGDLRRPGLPRRADLLRSPARLRQPRSPRSTSSRRRASSSTPARSAPTSSAPACAELADRHPSVGEVRGLGVFWALELVRDRATHAPLVPFNATGPDAAPMNEFAAACRERGLWPFTHFNRTHVVPPCTTTADRDRRRYSRFSTRPSSVADRYYEGSAAARPIGQMWWTAPAAPPRSVRRRSWPLRPPRPRATPTAAHG